MFPWARIVRPSDDRISRQQRRIAKRDRFVRIARSTDQVVRINQDRIAIAKHIKGDRIHVVNVDRSVDVPPFYAKVTSVVPNDNLPANFLPSTALVKHLVQISGVAKQLFSNLAIELQILVSAHEVRDFDKISKSSRHSLRFLLRHPHRAQYRWRRP